MPLGDLYASRAFLDTLRQGLLLYDLDGRVVDANDAAATLLGVPRADLIGRPTSDPTWRVIHEDGSDFAANDRPVEVTLRTHEECRGVILGVHSPDGRYSWLTVDSSPLESDGQLVGVSVVLDDVTVRLDLEHRLGAASDQLEILAKHPADVVVLASQDAVGEWCSDSITDLLGWSPDDVVGKRIDAFVHPEDLASILTYRSDSPDATTAQFLVRLRHRDGTYRWISISARRFFDKNRGTPRMVSSWRDVQSLVEARHALETSESRFRFLAENASDIIAETDADFHITWVSPSVVDILGWRPEDVIGRSVFNFVVEDLRPQVAQLNELLHANANAGRLKVRLLSTTGDQRWMLGRIRARFGDDGQALSYTMALRDIHDEEMVRHELRESEARYRLLAENGADLVVLIGTDDILRWASPSSYELFGWRPDELVGRSLADLVVADDLARTQSQIDESQDVFALENVRWRCADGDLRWVSSRGRKVRDARGAIDFVVVSIRDVTERIRAEQELADSESLFRLVLENQADVTARLDHDGGIEWITPSVLDLIGIPADQVVGHNISDFLNPEELEALLVVAERVQSGQPSDFEARVLTADGGEKWVSARGRPLSVDGLTAGSVINVRDISREHDMRTRLARSEAQLQMTMASAPVGMAVISLDRRFLSVNPALCDMVGRDEQWLLAHAINDLFGADETLDTRIREQALAGNAVRWTREKRLQRADGTPVWIEHAIALLKDEAGTPLSFVATFVDVTESRATKEKLRYQATHDTLTHLVNRGDLYLRAEELQRRTVRSGEHVGVLFLDIDGFKAVNDTYGHFVGDMTLKTVAERITTTGRSDDVIARVGGDEFVILLHALHSVHDAMLIAEKILARFADEIIVDGVSLTVGLSIGVALVEPGESADDTLRRADAALYEAKARGRGRCVAWDPSFDSPKP